MNYDEIASGLVKQFTGYVKDISVGELKGMSEARVNIYFEGGEFYTFPRDFKCNRGGILVFDSEGQADVPISPRKLRAQLIDDAEDLLQFVINHV